MDRLTDLEAIVPLHLYLAAIGIDLPPIRGNHSLPVLTLIVLNMIMAGILHFVVNLLVQRATVIIEESLAPLWFLGYLIVTFLLMRIALSSEKLHHLLTLLLLCVPQTGWFQTQIMIILGSLLVLRNEMLFPEPRLVPPLLPLMFQTGKVLFLMSLRFLCPHPPPPLPIIPNKLLVKES